MVAAKLETRIEDTEIASIFQGANMATKNYALGFAEGYIERNNLKFEKSSEIRFKDEFSRGYVDASKGAVMHVSSNAYIEGYKEFRRVHLT